MSEVHVCMRTADGPPSVPSVKGECSDCGAEIWLSARVQNDQRVKNMRRLCVQCAFPGGLPGPVELIDQIKRGDIELHPIVADEVRRWLTGKGEEGVGHD